MGEYGIAGVQVYDYTGGMFSHSEAGGYVQHHAGSPWAFVGMFTETVS